jgi:hypothetical protein
MPSPRKSLEYNDPRIDFPLHNPEKRIGERFFSARPEGVPYLVDLVPDRPCYHRAHPLFIAPRIRAELCAIWPGVANDAGPATSTARSLVVSLATVRRRLTG